MIYAVIDANVFVSAFITHNKRASTTLVFQHLLDGDIIPLYNDEILAEYEEVLSRNKFHLTEETVKEFRSCLRSCLKMDKKELYGRNSCINNL